MLFPSSLPCLHQRTMQVSKTFVAKTMKLIDKDNSGEVDVDEMVSCFSNTFFLELFVLFMMPLAGFLLYTKCRSGQ